MLAFSIIAALLLCVCRLTGITASNEIANFLPVAKIIRILTPARQSNEQVTVYLKRTIDLWAMDAQLCFITQRYFSLLTLNMS